MSNEANVFDVVVPLYNKERYVRAALESVLRQTHQPNRIIVVDDGSTDGSARAVDSIASPLIQLVRGDRDGVSAARNLGVMHSQSPVVAFLDADDLWTPQHLYDLNRLRKSFPECQVYATSYVFRDNEHDRAPIFRGLRDDTHQTIGRYFRVASQSDPPLFSSAIAVTRSALNAIGGFPVGIAQGEDLLTWARLACRFEIAFTPSVSVAFCQPEFGGGPTRRPEATDDVGPALVELLNIVPPEQRSDLRRYISLWHKMRGSMFAALGEPQHARQEYRQAVRYHPTSVRLLAKSLMTFLPTTQVQRINQAWILATRKPI